MVRPVQPHVEQMSPILKTKDDKAFCYMTKENMVNMVEGTKSRSFIPFSEPRTESGDRMDSMLSVPINVN